MQEKIGEPLRWLLGKKNPGEVKWVGIWAKEAKKMEKDCSWSFFFLMYRTFMTDKHGKSIVWRGLKKLSSYEGQYNG